MERPIRNESKGIGGLVLIVLAVFALIIIAASGIGRSVVDPQRREQTATPAAVKPPTAPTQSNQPAVPTNPDTQPKPPPVSAPVNPSPNVPPKAPAP